MNENEVNNYATCLLRRILCPVFKDSIARGIRLNLRKGLSLGQDLLSPQDIFPRFTV